MNISTNRNNKYAKYSTALFFSALTVLCWPMLALAAETAPSGADEAEEIREQNSDLSIDVPDHQTHANREADIDILVAIGNKPENVVGKKLQFINGENVGTIIDLRRKLDNLELYLIVDAHEFFNEAVTYAVAVQDVERLTKDTVLMPMQPGMHLRGFTYYEEEFTEADNNFAPRSVREIEEEVEGEQEVRE